MKYYKLEDRFVAFNSSACFICQLHAFLCVSYFQFFNKVFLYVLQISTSNITIHRDGRRSHLTDDSALGSLRDPDESTAHDADVDSDMEYRHQPLYYPNQHDSAR